MNCHYFLIATRKSLLQEGKIYLAPTRFFFSLSPSKKRKKMGWWALPLELQDLKEW